MTAYIAFGKPIMVQKIITNYDYPPIPQRSFDWSAHLDNYDGAPDAGFQPVGHGATEDEAVADLIRAMDDHEAEGSLAGEEQVRSDGEAGTSEPSRAKEER